MSSFSRKTWYVRHKYLICYISTLARISISNWFINLKEKKNLIERKKVDMYIFLERLCMLGINT